VGVFGRVLGCVGVLGCGGAVRGRRGAGWGPGGAAGGGAAGDLLHVSWSRAAGLGLGGFWGGGGLGRGCGGLGWGGVLGWCVRGGLGR